VAEGSDAHLEADAGDAAESFVHLKKLGGYGFRIADKERAGGATQGFELVASDRRPAAFLTDPGERFCVAREEVVGGLLVSVGNVAEGVDADFELLGGVTGTLTGYTVEVNKRAEAMRFAANDSDHERQAESSGTDKGLGCTSYAQPDGKRVL
jgi:hypothetical protein